MRKLAVLALGLVVVLLGGCSFLFPKGSVYITVDTIGATLNVVEFIPPGANAGSYPNEYSSYAATVNVAGYTWYEYEIRKGEYDAYIEWSGGIGFNGRTRIYVDPRSTDNQWVGVYADTGGNVWAETGGGTFDPPLSMYP